MNHVNVPIRGRLKYGNGMEYTLFNDCQVSSLLASGSDGMSTCEARAHIAGIMIAWCLVVSWDVDINHFPPGFHSSGYHF